MFRIVMVAAVAVSLSIAMLGCETGEGVKTSSTGTARKPTENILPRIDPKKEKGLVSTDGGFPVVLTVRNKTKATITLHWLDETDGSRVYYKDIQAGGEVLQGTYEDHYWIVLDKKEKPIGIYKTPGEDGIILIK
jgi:hypothetical protein